MPTNTVQDRSLLAGLTKFRTGLQKAITWLNGGVPTGVAGSVTNVELGANLSGTQVGDTLTIDAASDTNLVLSRYEFEFLGASAGAERYDYLPANFQITGAVLLAQPSGSCAVDVWVNSYSAFPPTVADSITAAAKPTISSNVKYKDTALTGWTTLLPSDRTITAHLDSVTTSTNVKLVLYGFQPSQAITAVVISGTLVSGTVGTPYSCNLPVTGGVTPYVNPVFSVALPSGLSASVVGTNVVVSGTPTTTASYSGTVTVQDAFGQTSNVLPVSFVIAPASFAYFDPANTSANLTLSNGNQTVTGPTPTSGWYSARSITSHNSGQYYAEFNDDINTSTYLLCGVGTSATNLSNFAGSDAASWGVHCNKPNPIDTYHFGSPTAGGSGSIGAGGRAYVAVDFGAGKMWLGTSALAGTWCGGGDPVTGTSPTYTFPPGTTLYLVCSIFDSAQTASLKNNVGENTGTIPSGYAMWG